MQRLILKSTGRIAHMLSSALYTALICWSSNGMAAAGPPPPAPLQISQVPMTITLPAHPQIMLALGNSQSMDGDLSGAIYTGSGQIPHPLLFTSSSPVNFTIPAGFTPPVDPGAGGVAPYTVNTGGQLLDNSDSRLNVAKAGITAILNAFIASADFGLIDYETPSPGLYTTWVYQMSNPGGFTFTSSPTAPAGSELVPNPCFGIDITQGFPTSQDCNTLNTRYSGQNIHDQTYMVVAQSSDDAVVNDVLYAPNGYADPVCITYGTVYPATQFTAPNSLAAYNGGGVFESYPAATSGCGGVMTTNPTNAGFVPASAEVMYEERGFGYYAGQTANSGHKVVDITSSGATPDPTSVANAINWFTQYLAPETNNGGTPEIKAQAVQSPIAGLVKYANWYFANVNPASTNGCATQRYLVLLTDGLPTEDLNGRLWPPLGSSSATGYGVTFANDQAYIDTINQLTLLAAAGIKTYIIGMGQATNPTAYPIASATLNAMAAAGGTGTYFAATSPSDVTTDLQVIVTKILDQSQSTASAAVNSTGLNANSIVYQSQFVTSDVDQDWTGNLFAFPISATTGVVNTLAPYWSAQPLLDATAAANTRLIATWDPVQNKGIPFEWSGGTPINGIAATTVLGQDLQAFAPDTNGSDVLQYLRGSTAQEKSNGGQFRNRSHILGDIVDSNPAYIGPSNEGIQATSYINFAASTANRTPILYIGANDGMLHAFDVTAPVPPSPGPASATMGQELFAYMPRGVYGNLINLVNPYYNAQHRFFVNGSPEAADVQFSDLSWHSVLVGSEAAGGNSVYALDVTTPASINSETALASAVLWDFTDVDMGLGYSEPVVANTSSGWAVLVGNGYNSTHEKPFLYALNPQTGGTGAPILNPSGGAGSWAKIDLCANVPAACNLTKANGLSSLTAVNSGGEVAGLANLVYAGDLQGNLWRVDISNPNPALWAVSVLFQAADATTGGNRQPITTKPVVSLNPRFPQVLGTMVLFGTGQFLGVPDLTNQNVQTIYGVYDPPGGQATPLNRGNLLPQTLHTATVTTFSGGTQEVRYITGAVGTVPANPGWYIDLSLLSGERVINDPRLESGGELVLTTYQPIPPAAGSCNASGSSYLMVLNFATGGAFTTPQFDATGDGKINSSDTVIPTGGTVAVAPVGMSLGLVYASAPTIRSGSFTSGTGIALITESVPGLGVNGTGTGGATPVIQPVILKGSSKSRTAWWEIRQ
jgi:type IV pilus assembly protein PilY1